MVSQLYVHWFSCSVLECLVLLETNKLGIEKVHYVALYRYLPEPLFQAGCLQDMSLTKTVLLPQVISVFQFDLAVRLYTRGFPCKIKYAFLASSNNNESKCNLHS